jgi:hypothetical protein
MKKSDEPYETVPNDRPSPFLRIETEQGVSARPWHALQTIRMNPESTELTLEYASATVKISGRELEHVAELACSARLKCVRTGVSDGLEIRAVRVVGEERE